MELRGCVDIQDAMNRMGMVTWLTDWPSWFQKFASILMETWEHHMSCTDNVMDFF